MVVFSVMYPAKPGARFDHGYYDQTHIPLVQGAFSASGLRSVQVLRGLPGPDGSAAPYVLIANLTFESPEALQACLTGPRAPEIFADLGNFTDIQPVTQVSAPQ